MNDRNQNQNRQQALAPTPAPTPAPAVTHMNVVTVEEYEANGKTGKRCTKIGAAFPHKEGSGFRIGVHAFPIDGRLVVRSLTRLTIGPNNRKLPIWGP